MSADDAKEVIIKETVPGWVYALKPLVGVASGLATIGTNPEKWVRQVIAGWFVGGALDALQWFIGWILYAFGTIQREILQAAGPLSAPIVLITSAMVDGIRAFYLIPRMIAGAAGLAGPPAAAFSIALLSAFLAVVVYALYYAILNFVPGGGLLEGVEENLES